jgi:RluA family pseudouridine synthase
MSKAYRITVKKPRTLIDLVSQFTDSRKRAKKVIDEGLCSVNGIKELFYKKQLKPRNIVRFTIPDLLFKRPEIEILFEDEYLLVVNKPPFINSNRNAPNVEMILRKRFKNARAVHRLDKQTTGALIVAKSKEVFELFIENFRRREIKKNYLVLTTGNLREKSGKITTPIDGKEAISIYRVIKHTGKTDLLEVEILTGRKHQIRKHFAFLSHPVVGEFIYWKRKFPEEIHLFAPRIMLHAERLVFKHPVKGKKIEIKAPLLEDFKNYIETLEGKRSLQILTLQEYT